MDAEYLPDERLSEMMNAIVQIPGDLAEVGLGEGGLFKRLVAVAQVLKRTVHGFDRFEGASNAREAFRERMLESIRRHRQLAHEARQDVGVLPGQIQDDCFELWPGSLEEGLDACPVSEFAFIYLNPKIPELSTEMIRAFWARLSPGGIIGFSRYAPDQEEASSAEIDGFLQDTFSDWHLVHFSRQQLFLRRKPDVSTRREVA